MALLLMGVLPLLAKDDVPDVYSDVVLEEVENDVVPHQNAAEKMYDDALTSIPSLRSLHFVSPTSANFVMVDHLFDVDAEFLEGNSSSRITSSLPSPQDVIEQTIETELADVPDLTADVEVPVEPQPPDAEKLDEVEQDNAEIASKEESIAGAPVTESHSEPLQANDQSTEGEDEEDGTANRLLVDYANKAAGALVLERSPSMKGASNLLTNDKDKYAITPCKDKKFVVIGLSEDILVKQIKIANYELYSSHVKDFQVLGSQTMGQWVDLGTFTANHGNGEQAFDLPEPSWARYLKFRFISHHRNEHYCTLSQIQVHGSTMLQGFREQWKEGEEDEQEQEFEPTVVDDTPDDGIVEEAKSQQEGASASEAVKDPNTVPKASAISEHNLEPEITTNAESDEAGDEEVLESTPVSHDLDDDKEEEQQGKAQKEKLKGLQALHQSMFDLQSIPVPNALEFVRFDLAANRIVNASTPQRTSRLPVHLIPSLNARRDLGRSVQHSMMKVVGEATVTGQLVGASSKMSLAVRELQSRIQTTIGKTWELHDTIQTMIGKALPGLRPDWGDAVAPVGDKSDTTDAEENIVAETPPSDQADSITPMDHDDTDQVNPMEEVAPVLVEPVLVVGVEMSEGLAKIISRYPSAKCLESLHFPTFKKSIIAKAAAKATTANGSTNSHVGKMEPIFKTLTDEIKALQVSQNVHDQFSRALMACYQDIMIDMASDLQATQVLQEDRIAKLEAGMKQMHSQSWFSQIPSRVISLSSFILSLALIAYSQSYALLEDLDSQLCQLGGGPRVIAWACLLAAVLVAAMARREMSRKYRTKPPPPPSSKPEETIPLVAEFPCHSTQRLDNMSHSVMPCRKNARIPKSRSLQLFPAE